MANQEWLKSLTALSADNLRFEREKRTTELSELELRFSLRLYREGQRNDEWEQSFEDASARGAVRKHFNASGYETEIDVAASESRMEERIRQLREEISAIDRVFDSTSKG